MGVYCYKGVTNKKFYQFHSTAMPTVLLDGYGNPVVQGTYDSQTVIQANHDGSVQRGTAGPSSFIVNNGQVDIYGPGYTPSPWEKQ